MMKSSKASLAKGMAIGLAVGGATAIAGSAMMNNKATMKKAKKTAAKAMKTVSGIMDNVSSMPGMKF